MKTSSMIWRTCTRRPLPASNPRKPARRYSVEVNFSLHCFTRGLAQNEQPDQTQVYADSREGRIFDFQRYELSKLLPDIVQGLPERKCYHSGKGNFFTVAAAGGEGQAIEYDIFFEVSRSAEKRGVIKLFVQSAYVRDAQHDSNRPRRKPIGFYVILFNTLTSKPIKIPI
jgi:hypothetical protein